MGISRGGIVYAANTALPHALAASESHDRPDTGTAQLMAPRRGHNLASKAQLAEGIFPRQSPDLRGGTVEQKGIHMRRSHRNNGQTRCFCGLWRAPRSRLFPA